MKLDMLTADGRREFLEARRTGIGSSDIGAICGIDPWRDAIDVYFEKTRPVTDDEGNIHTLRGVLLEDIGAQIYTQLSGNKIRRHRQRAHPEHRWAQSNIDRQILANGDGKPTGALEVKAPGTGSFARYIDYGLPDHLTSQLQWQLFTTGYDWGEWAIVNLEHSAGPLLRFEMERNDKLIEQMVEVGEEFWELVERREMPSAMKWVGGDPKVEVPQHDTTRHKVTEDPDGMIAGLMEAQQLRKDGQELYDARGDLLKAWMEAEGITRLEHPELGKVNHTWREGRTQTSLKKVRAARPLDRDKVEAWLRERASVEAGNKAVTVTKAGKAAFMDSMVEGTLIELELDWSAFEYHNEPHRAFQAYPRGEK